MGQPSHSSGLIARQVALGFGAVSVVALIMCALLISVISDVSGLVAGMRHDEAAIRQGRELATAVRELSLAADRALMSPGPETHGRYTARYAQLLQDLDALAPRLSPQAQADLQATRQAIAALHRHFHTEAWPAAERGDQPAVQSLHGQLAALGVGAAERGDALARAAASQMAHAHDLATDSTRVGLIVGALCLTLVLALSVGFTLRLRQAVLRPLVALTEAASRFGAGDFDQRVGEVGQGELAALGVAFDRMADELARREASLLQSERMAAIGQLAAGVAHEMNNPIGIIRGYLKTMSPEDDPEALEEELAILDEEAAQCERIARDLLTFARADELESGPVAMAALIKETAARFGEGPDGRGRRVEIQAAAAEVQADRARLRQVLLNLLANAAQASPEETAVCIQGLIDGEGYQVAILDEGPGVAPEDASRLFEPFFSRRRGGSGLGLAVCQGIVQAHGGRLEVGQDDVGRTRFAFTLPITSAGEPS